MLATNILDNFNELDHACLQIVAKEKLHMTKLYQSLKNSPISTQLLCYIEFSNALCTLCHYSTKVTAMAFIKLQYMSVNQAVW